MAETVFSTDVRGSMKKFERFAGFIMKIGIRDFMFKKAGELVGQVKLDTPVDKGRLRRAWRMTATTATKEVVEIEVSNPVEYAEYVEYGHRIRNRSGKVVGYQAGVFMLDKNVRALNQTIEKDLEKYIDDEARRMGLSE